MAGGFCGRDHGTKRQPRGTGGLAASARFPPSRGKPPEPKKESGADERARMADLLITREMEGVKDFTSDPHSFCD